jgi:hypothetical protein
MADREPWGTLITNHQHRFSGYSFVKAPWSRITTIEDLGQVTGERILEYRKTGDCPVVVDEDRYENYFPPKYARYFFRRFMWASLLSGGHATYGGLETYIPLNDGAGGIRGYHDACREGRLEYGAHDFPFIYQFFNDARLNLVKMIPDDGLAGNEPLRFKAIRSIDMGTIIIYIANPDIFERHATDGYRGCYTDEMADESQEIPYVSLVLPKRAYDVRWFDPAKGTWVIGKSLRAGEAKLEAPGTGDWILLLTAAT